MVKACSNENKKDTKYCCNEISGLDINCCFLGQRAQFIDFGSMDVHGTAMIVADGRVSSIPVTSNGKHVFCRAMGILTLNIYR